LGHERCGAVTATQSKETSLRSYWFFVKAIRPAIAKTTGELDDPVDKAVVAMFSIKLREVSKLNDSISTITG